MATVESLERLQRLVERLLPLASARPGETVRADDWNTLVDALIDVARVALAEARTATSVPAHDHPDQVKLSWLDPGLRDLLGRGGLGGPGRATLEIRAQLDLDRLRKRFEEVNSELGSLRDRVTVASSRDLVREADFSQLRRSVDQVSGSGADDILALRRQLDTVAADVTRAVGVADRLTLDGAPVDIGALVGKVAAIERLRDALTLPTGELLSADGLEQRLTQLTATLVTEADLSAALRSRRARLDPAQLDGLAEQLTTDLRGRVDGDFASLRQELTARTDERLAGVRATIAEAIEQTQPGLRAGIEASVEARLTTGLAEARAAILADSGARIDVTAQRLRDELGGAVEAVRGGMAAAIGASLREQLPASLAGFEGRLAGLAVRLDGTESGVRRIDTAIGSVSGRLGELTTELRAGVGAVQTRLTGELAAVRGEIGTARGEFDGKLSATETRLGGRIETRIGEVNRAFEQRIDLTKVELRDSLRVDRGRFGVDVGRIDFGGGGVIR